MGMFGPFSRCSDDSCRPERDRRIVYMTKHETKRECFGNPNPSRFRIMRHKTVGRFAIIEIEYPDCMNYEGRKILVFEGVAMRALNKLVSIDPHFCASDAHPSPVARFVPTAKGWNFAVSFAKNA